MEYGQWSIYHQLVGNEVICNIELWKSNLCKYNDAYTPVKSQNYMSLSLFYQQKATKNYQNWLAKDLKNQCIGINIKQKRKENTTNESTYFIELNFVLVNRFFALIYSNQDSNSKRFKARGYYLPKRIINNYKIIFDGKIFHDPLIPSDIEQYKQIKLTTRQGEDYTTGCLLD